MGLAKDIVKDNKKILLLTLGLFVMSLVGVFLLRGNLINVNSTVVEQGPYTQAKDVLEEGVDYQALIRTEYGDIEVDLYEQQSPNAVNSFVFLAGENFYDGLTFHKVVQNFVIQAGDQLGDGEGDPGYTLETDESQLEATEYSMCMANASQFFIVPKGADISQLQEYPVVGSVTSGFSVVDVIEKVPVDTDGGYKPLNDITITSVLIIEE